MFLHQVIDDSVDLYCLENKPKYLARDVSRAHHSVSQSMTKQAFFFSLYSLYMNTIMNEHVGHSKNTPYNYRID